MSVQNSKSIADTGIEKKIHKYQWGMVITAGMGFFTDAYDLFVIGVVTAILVPIWHLTTMQLALLNGAALASAAFGAIIFGYLADRFGRKKMYGIEVLILFIGAILSAVSTSYAWLLVSRIVVGLGIGGDYPSSAVVVSEHAHHEHRGFLVLLVFAMQALGLVVGPLIASLLLSFHLSPEITWRVLFALGAIPAASVFFLRRKISETPRFLRAKELKEIEKEMPFEVSRVVSDLTGYHEHDRPLVAKPQKIWSRKWIKCLIGTAGAWFLLDVALYGNGVSSVLIMNEISPHASLLKHTLLSAIIFFCFAMPGYFFAAKFVDTIGRRNLQQAGFFIMAICYAWIAFIHNPSAQLPLFIILFGLSFFFINFGPNATTFLIPSEIFPTNIRASAHGISAATGKVGAFIGTFCLPPLLTIYGMTVTMIIIAIVSFAGILISFLIPEMKGVSLDETEITDEIQPTSAKTHSLDKHSCTELVH